MVFAKGIQNNEARKTMNEILKCAELTPIENLDISQFITEENESLINLMVPNTMMPDLYGDNRRFLLSKFSEVTVELRPEWCGYLKITCYKK